MMEEEIALHDKFQSPQNLSIDNVEIVVPKQSPLVSEKSPQFSGLSKKELQAFINDPFWKRVRLGLFAGFWLLWAVLLISAVIILVKTPTCPKTYDLKWCRSGFGYVVDVSSFYDNGDGSQHGNLKGLTSKIKYIRDIGFDYVIFRNKIQLSIDSISTEMTRVFDDMRQVADDQVMKLVIDLGDTSDKSVEMAHYWLTTRRLDGVHVYVTNMSAMPDIYEKVNNIGKSTLKPRALIARGKLSDPNEENAVRKWCDLLVNDPLVRTTYNSTSQDLYNVILDNFENRAWMADCLEYLRATVAGDILMNIHLPYLLPGAALSVYGSEIGMKNNDKCYSPYMSWTPMNYTDPDCTDLHNTTVQNVRRLSASGAPQSPHHLISNLIAFRKSNPLFSFGEMVDMKTIGKSQIYWSFTAPLYPTYIVLANIGHTGDVIPLDCNRYGQPDGSCNLEVKYSTSMSLKSEQLIPASSIYVEARSIVVLMTNTTVQTTNTFKRI